MPLHDDEIGRSIQFTRPDGTVVTLMNMTDEEYNATYAEGEPMAPRFPGETPNSGGRHSGD